MTCWAPAMKTMIIMIVIIIIIIIILLHNGGRAGMGKGREEEGQKGG